MGELQPLTAEEYSEECERLEARYEDIMRKAEQEATDELKRDTEYARQRRLTAIIAEIDTIIGKKTRVDDDEAVDLSQLSADIEEINTEHNLDKLDPSPEAQALYAKARAQKERADKLVNEDVSPPKKTRTED